MLTKKNNIQEININVKEFTPLISSKYAPTFQNISITSHTRPSKMNSERFYLYLLLTNASGSRAIHHTKY